MGRRKGEGIFIIFKHSWALKRSWKTYHGGPGTSWIFLSVKRVGTLCTEYHNFWTICRLHMHMWHTMQTVFLQSVPKTWYYSFCSNFRKCTRILSILFHRYNKKCTTSINKITASSSLFIRRKLSHWGITFWDTLHLCAVSWLIYWLHWTQCRSISGLSLSCFGRMLIIGTICYVINLLSVCNSGVDAVLQACAVLNVN